MGRTSSSNKKRGHNDMSKCKSKNRKSIISHTDRKKNRLMVEKLNKSSINESASISQEIRHHNMELSKQKKRQPGVGRNALYTKRLIIDHKKDKVIQKQIEKKEKETEDSMLKQIEMISGFSL